MTPSIGVAATFRDECNALPGFLESASHFFDNIFLADCSPGGVDRSTDGSLDIIRKWGLPDPPLWNLNDGFGVVRSRLMNESPTDWTVVLDIDERMLVTSNVLHCEGTEGFPQVEHPKLTVTEIPDLYNHLELLKKKIEQAENEGIRTVRFRRRHWFDTTYLNPTQNWLLIPDFQLRCMKSRAGVGYTSQRMHERAWDSIKLRDPEYIEEDCQRGPFIDHFHCWFKRMEVEQRKTDIAAYDALHHSDTHTPIVTP